MLVVIGTDEYGEKEILGIMDGFWENADSWRDLLRSLKKRGLTQDPELAIGPSRKICFTNRLPGNGRRVWILEGVSDLLCMSKSAHASPTKEHEDNDDFQGTFRRAVERR